MAKNKSGLPDPSHLVHRVMMGFLLFTCGVVELRQLVSNEQTFPCEIKLLIITRFSIITTVWL